MLKRITWNALVIMECKNTLNWYYVLAKIASGLIHLKGDVYLQF